MYLAFDMDGVLRKLDLSMIRLNDAIKNKDSNAALQLHILTETAPVMNPAMFALQDDEIFCITNCSSKNSAAKKRRWLKHFFGDRVKMLPTFIAPGAWGEDYYLPTAQTKLKVCYENMIDVYFDDCPDIIKHMRRIHEDDCNETKEIPYIKFIKYGAWIEEGFE